MATILQFRRYETAEISGFTPNDGEIFVEIRSDGSRGIRIGDDEDTAGGQLLTTRFADLSGVVSDNPAMNAALNLKLDVSIFNDHLATAASQFNQKVDRSVYEARINAVDAILNSLAGAVLNGTLVDIPSGVSEITVEFDTAMTNPPIAVVVSVRKPSADAHNIFATTRDVSETGFTVDLSGVTDSADYKLEYCVLGT